MAPMAFFSGVSFGEMVLIGVIAILVFGHRLPEVAGKVMRHVALLRRQVEDFRRETGIDRELRNVQNTMRDVTREANSVPPPEPPTPAPPLPGPEDGEASRPGSDAPETLPRYAPDLGDRREDAAAPGGTDPGPGDDPGSAVEPDGERPETTKGPGALGES